MLLYWEFNCFRIIKTLLSFVAHTLFYITLIISQIVGVFKVCDHNVDRVSKNDKICHICSMTLKRLLVKCDKYGTWSIYDPITKKNLLDVVKNNKILQEKPSSGCQPAFGVTPKCTTLLFIFVFVSLK